jgi:predicted nucleic acid-binding protein
MADYYADSSALVKRHVHERGTIWFQSLTGPAAGNTIATAQVSEVEVYSALNRRLRESHLSFPDYTQIADDFALICATEYKIIELTDAVIERSRLLLERHPLRAYDAIQLASALIANTTLQAAGFAPLTFLAADDRLLNAAQAEGLVTDNPNAHS